MLFVPTVEYNNGKVVHGEPAFQSYLYGRDGFLPMIGDAYTLECGNRDRLTIGTIYWRPGAKYVDEFNLPGEWGISDDQQEPSAWQPVTAATVFAFNEPDCWEWIALISWSALPRCSASTRTRPGLVSTCAKTLSHLACTCRHQV